MLRNDRLDGDLENEQGEATGQDQNGCRSSAGQVRSDGPLQTMRLAKCMWVHGQVSDVFSFSALGWWACIPLKRCWSSSYVPETVYLCGVSAGNAEPGLI